jgi:hypothetical protein
MVGICGQGLDLLHFHLLAKMGGSVRWVIQDKSNPSDNGDTKQLGLRALFICSISFVVF